MQATSRMPDSLYWPRSRGRSRYNRSQILLYWYGVILGFPFSLDLASRDICNGVKRAAFARQPPFSDQHSRLEALCTFLGLPWVPPSRILIRSGVSDDGISIDVECSSLVLHASSYHCQRTLKATEIYLRSVSREVSLATMTPSFAVDWFSDGSGFDSNTCNRLPSVLTWLGRVRYRLYAKRFILESCQPCVLE